MTVSETQISLDNDVPMVHHISMLLSTPGLLSRFTYVPRSSGNRRATGSHWRGHKLFATIAIRVGATIYLAKDHQAQLGSGPDNPSVAASRICRASGEVMDNKWFFTMFGRSYYVLDTDVVAVELASVKLRKISL